MSAQISKPRGVIGAVLGLAGFSVLAGVLVTAMVTPVLAVTGVTANNTVGIFDNLPDYITIGQQSQRNTLWAKQGGVDVPFANVFSQDREEVTWENVSQFAKDAAVAGEDQRFYQHGGVDLAGIARAAVNNATTDTSQGASTLDQQLVKNLLIQDAVSTLTGAKKDAAVAAAQASTLDRKLKEAKLAIGLEKRYTKNEILLGYLNIAPFGGNTYGIEAAAQRYYSTSAKDLTLAQATSLIAIVQAPNQRKPDVADNWPSNQSRRDAILGNMLKLKKVTQAQYNEAVAVPVNETTLKISTSGNGCYYATAAKYFCDYVVRHVPQLVSLGSTAAERKANWLKGGYDIYTTIDLDENKVAEDVLAAKAPATETRFSLGAASSSVEVGTGRILTMAQNKTFDNTDAARTDATRTAINFNTDRNYGGSSGFQVGSTYKLFTLVDWLKNGHGLQEVVNGSPATYRLPRSCGAPSVPYLFSNDGNARFGSVSVLRATASSINSAFASMASKLDLCDIRDTAASMGVHRADGAELKTNPTMVIGTDEIAPLTMANAYATVSSGGILCQPIAVDRIVDALGKTLPGQNADCQAVPGLTPEVAAAAAQALQGVMKGGTGNAANPNDGTALIGKTGTADGTSTFIVSASTKVASAAWVGNIIGDQNLRRITIGGTNGGQLRFPIMKAILTSMDKSVYAKDPAAFPEPPRSLVTGSTQAVPSVVGLSMANAESLIRSLGLGFRLGDAVASELQSGLAAASSPGAGSRASKGAIITVSPSDGSLATQMPSVTGLTARAAGSIVIAAGFDPSKFVVKFIPSAAGQLCTVASTTPAGGSPTATTTAVTFTVNGGVMAGGVEPVCP